MSPLWRARDLKGSVTLWELLGVTYRPWMGRVVLALSNCLTRCENEAQAERAKDKAQ